MGKIMYGSTVLTRSAMLTYLSLPFAIATVCAWQIPVGARRISWRMLTLLLLAGVTGWLLYNVVPGTGPLYAFRQDFPWNSIAYADLSKFVLEKMSIPENIPRNAMPSLHVGWVVLLFWNSRGMPRVLRAALCVYLLLTVIATLGSGQHYLVDLVVSLPFALTMQAVVSYKHSEKSRRIPAAATGVALTAAWLLLVRFGVSWAMKSPAVPWTLILLTASITVGLESWMSKTKFGEANPVNCSPAFPTLAGSVQ
jgi:hypothetical protein